MSYLTPDRAKPITARRLGDGFDRAAVLPTEKGLCAALFHHGRARPCAECGTMFVPRSNRGKYCDKCAGGRKPPMSGNAAGVDI